MNKYTYFVIQLINDDTGAEVAYVRRIRNCNNLLGLFNRPADGCRIVSINACDGKTTAEKIADAWNEASIKKGRYMLSDAHIYPAHAY